MAKSKNIAIYERAVKGTQTRFVVYAQDFRTIRQGLRRRNLRCEVVKRVHYCVHFDVVRDGE